MGAALGSIIATIITTHITKTSQRLTTVGGTGAAIRAPIEPKSDADIGIHTRYSQERAVSVSNAARITNRSAWGKGGSVGRDRVDSIVIEAKSDVRPLDG